ncbi:MAG: hypothetical protein D3904_11225, partial [Candidatus Electrothrix sp. EH2]|nr:hypothetical protein [Candidatus Electrothrix sp. EH2]
GLRPEAFTLETERQAEHLSLPCQVLDAEFLGYDTLLRFQLTAPLKTALNIGERTFTARIFQQLNCAVGENIAMNVDVSATCFFDQSGTAV